MHLNKSGRINRSLRSGTYPFCKKNSREKNIFLLAHFGIIFLFLFVFVFFLFFCFFVTAMEIANFLSIRSA